MNIYKTSQAGIDLIKDYETLIAKAKDVEINSGIYTIGYGHRSTDVKSTDTITASQAEILLKSDLEKFENTVNNAVKVNITQNQFDALVSYVYNSGAGANDSVFTVLNTKDFTGAAFEFTKTRKVGSDVWSGLVKRRNDEIELFMGGDAIREENATDYYQNFLNTGNKKAFQDFLKQSMPSNMVQMMNFSENSSGGFDNFDISSLKVFEAGYYTNDNGILKIWFNADYADPSKRDIYAQIETPAEIMQAVKYGKLGINDLSASVVQITYSVDEEKKEYTSAYLFSKKQLDSLSQNPIESDSIIEQGQVLNSVDSFC